jgi:hypothetical protein
LIFLIVSSDSDSQSRVGDIFECHLAFRRSEPVSLESPKVLSGY